MSITVIKRAAVFTLLTFTLMIISANYSFAKDVDINEEIIKAKGFYNNGDYNSALKIVDKIISTYSGEIKTHKNELCSAYLLKAKIHFDFEDIIEMREALRKLFYLNPHYIFSFGEENLDFIEIAEEIRNVFIEEQKRIEKGNVISREFTKKKKKKFPALLVVAGVAVTAAAIYFLTKKKKSQMYTLVVSRGEGVDGSPDSGSYSYKEKNVVNYNYTLRDDYTNLVVTLDGQEVGASGTITMNRDHTLSVAATRLPDQYTLTVNRGEGAAGIPESGSYTYYQGTTVNYSYNLQGGYSNLVVTLDGNPVSASGSITMNSNHTLIASASVIGDNPPTVEITRPGDGDTVSGTVEIKATAADDKGINKVEFYIDNTIINTKTVRPYNSQWNTTTYFNGSHQIKVVVYDTINQKGEQQITVTVNNDITEKYVLDVVAAQEGVTGTPQTGTYEYNRGDQVSYNYSAQTGYSITVKLDGSAVAAAGTITMDRDHQLVVTASLTSQK